MIRYSFSALIPALISATILVIILGALPVGAIAATPEPPIRTDENVIVAFYNIQWLGQKPRDLTKLASVIRHFDICKVIEIKNETALKDLTRALEAETGKDWGYVFGTRTRRPGGRYFEAFGALWRRDRVALGDGLVGGIWDPDERFRNDPYLTAFQAGASDFILFSLHTRWTDDREGSRADEIRAIADQLDYYRRFLDEGDIFVGGDFNEAGDAPAMQAMAEAAQLTQLDDNPKTTFKTNGTDYANPYDHIFATPSAARMVRGKAEALDVTRLIYGARTPAAMKRSRIELSDHLPVFMILERNPEAPAP